MLNITTHFAVLFISGKAGTVTHPRATPKTPRETSESHSMLHACA